MNVELYSGSGDFYQYTEEQIVGFTNGVVGPFPAVVENDQIRVMQPWDPSNDLAWADEASAIAWGESFIASAEAVQVEVESTEALRQSAIDKLLNLGLTEDEIKALGLLGPSLR
jgi:hypothetical protein